MPELPDIVVYVESLERRVVGRTLEQVRLKSPFVLRTAVPPLTDVVGKRVIAVRRIGNAYSDEILHRARLSPIAQTHKLDPGEVLRLYASAQSVLTEWTLRLREEAGSGFPTKVTAFRPQMAVHGRFGEPCPDCGAPVQRIVYAENETNYCARCQTGGTILADRALSRLLKSSWPRSIDELG